MSLNSQSQEGVWEPIEAGLAVLLKFLANALTADKDIIIKRITKNEVTNTKEETQVIEKIREQRVKVNFSNTDDKDVLVNLHNVMGVCPRTAG
ncbi:MAG: hypothetical protein LBS82_00875 [Spirochaetaceae bacterium]|nr:hypothetical protein [Spirochaetaceae bacterium]